ncbi:hypothetical protein EIN_525910 [Entamoeba invadens IP1]|uniref:Uncharacterized protein n=1 Tax=Entamoeba invadens IP1 TaxID=370355 RepID=A0A0A1U8Y8_ENTIV|nr:hypothetical protein EIN_525910 [Entamoeba invadens IP1]ELP89596.1 hypothetical protein EIN_525910 [Entamoeba invadens IP1]|eukprot:XP_004256367.1 hypothetical protein EIN_525910 [Entamoeba invadens IP1]
MFVTSLLNRRVGLPEYIKEIEENRAFLIQRVDRPETSPHDSRIQSIEQLTSCDCVSSKEHIELVTAGVSNRLDIRQNGVYSHPTLPISICLRDNGCLILDSFTMTDEVRTPSPSGVAFLVQNIFGISSKNGLNLFDIKNRKLVGGIDVICNSVASNGFDVYCGGETIQCFDTRTFKEKWRYNSPGIVCKKVGDIVAYSKTNFYALNDFGEILWSLKKQVKCVEISPNGRFCYMADYSGNIEVYTVGGGAHLNTLSGVHGCGVSAMSWSDRSMDLITGDENGMVLRWTTNNLQTQKNSNNQGLEDEWN